MKEQATFQGCTTPATLSMVVLARHWPLSDSYQQKLLTLVHLEVVYELILVGKQMQELPPLLIKEPKLRSF